MYLICIISYFKGKFIFIFLYYYFNEGYVLYDEYIYCFDINYFYIDNMCLMCNLCEFYVMIFFKFM